MTLPTGVKRVGEARNERLHGYAWVIDIGDPDHDMLEIGKVEGIPGNYHMVGYFEGIVSRQASALGRDEWVSRVRATHIVKTGSPFCEVIEAFLVAIEMSGDDWEQQYAAWDMIFKPLGEELVR